MVHCVLTLLSSVQPQPRRTCWFEAGGTRATDFKLIPALVDFDGDHGLLVAHQAAEEISQNFQQAVLLREQMLTMDSLIIFTDSGAPVDPGAADISAHGARCNADLGIVANALHLAGISFGINIENGDGGRVAQYIPSELDGSGHTDPRPAEGFQVQVLRPGELRDAIRHYGPPIRVTE